MLSDVENAMWESDSEDEQVLGQSKPTEYGYKSSTDEQVDYFHMKREKNGADVVNLSRAARENQNKSHKDNNSEAFDRNAGDNFRKESTKENYESEDLFSDAETAMWESDAEEELGSETSKLGTSDYRSNSEDEDYVTKTDGKDGANNKKMKRQKQVDKAWDSD